MFKRTAYRTISFTAAMTIAFSGLGIGSSYAAKATDDMDAVSFTKALLGSEFTNSQESPTKGFDSSGLLYYVYKSLDYSMPRTLSAQLSMDKPTISKISNLVAGDAVFFGSGKKPTFAGIYVGNNKVVTASQNKDEVITRELTAELKGKFIGAKRILSSNDRVKVQLVLDGRKYLGVPYVFGAKYGQTKTFDCSSFMKTIYHQNGIELPRISRNQAKEGVYVSKSNLEVGDLVFFTTSDSGGRIGHVGMYVGNRMMLHTYGEGGVKYTSIDKEFWKDHYVTARRVIK
jgi:cell wall-associated NlpC family hydrolase